MEYRPLGKTGLNVSVIAMGCEGFAVDDCALAKDLFDVAEDGGVNYFDLFTPDPDVRSAVGRALEGRREKFIIQSHICSVWKNGQYERSRDLEEAKEAFEDSLERLRTDYIDVGMIHYCDSMSDWQAILDNGILQYAKELKEAGKIRHIGLSSHNPLVAMHAIETADIEVLMFSINPCYDLQPASEDVEDLWADATYTNEYENMDPDRQKLYELCQSKGVGITVMKAFGGGDLMNAELSPAGVALTPAQCISYALSRPGVATVCSGAKSVKDLEVSIAYTSLPAEKRDYAEAIAGFPRVSWHGHCMYCTHCQPCPMNISIADVTKFMNLVIAQGGMPETVRDHYKLLEAHAGDCIQCGRCESRCPFDVNIRENMQRAEEIFGY